MFDAAVSRAMRESLRYECEFPDEISEWLYILRLTNYKHQRTVKFCSQVYRSALSKNGISPSERHYIYLFSPLYNTYQLCML